MRWLKDIWTEVKRERELNHRKPVSKLVLRAAESMLERLQEGLDYNIEDHLVLTRMRGNDVWQLKIDFSEDSAERVFGQNILNDLKRILGDRRQYHRIPPVLDEYSRFGIRR